MAAPMQEANLDPSVTVIIPVRPGSTTIQNALRSLCSQEFKNWHVLGLLDRDNGDIRKIFCEILPKEKYQLVDVDVSKSGLGAVRNLAIELSESEFIAMLDCDDISLANRFEDQIQIMLENPKCGIVAGVASVTDIYGSLKYVISPPATSDDIKRKLLSENCIVQSSVLLRKSIIQQAGSYKSMTHGCEDYDLWLRLIPISEFFSTQTAVVQYLINPAGVTRRRIPRESIRQLNKSRSAAQKYLKVPFLKRAYQTLIWNLKQIMSDIKKLRVKIST
jgi:glycosyltransferase involved in cell wall biosynthesis